MHMNHPDLIKADVAVHWLTIAALETDAAELMQAIQSGTDQTNDPILEIRQLIAKGELEYALQKLIFLSEQEPPNIEALTRLAWLYEAGLGVDQDIGRAAELFKRAAEEGNAEAQYAISVMYETGIGQKQDRVQAEYWLEKSAKQSYQPAVDKLSSPK
ncbi:tetratricopeptide repeat protein [Neptuniibacter sp.]|uniref:tetratricopeptide repeat protein n=1 Tax=Neptuniibacter sp. TaxID=1962643 RepID=UPI002620FDAD|nr:tetratricopeptide repeat protein [Neptuniibacter sp.]MCP4595408.1 sel1 repeat family protein [Neptuniibacter sp.]